MGASIVTDSNPSTVIRTGRLKLHPKTLPVAMHFRQGWTVKNVKVIVSVKVYVCLCGIVHHSAVFGAVRSRRTAINSCLSKQFNKKEDLLQDAISAQNYHLDDSQRNEVRFLKLHYIDIFRLRCAPTLEVEMVFNQMVAKTVSYPNFLSC